LRIWAKMILLRATGYLSRQLRPQSFSACGCLMQFLYFWVWKPYNRTQPACQLLQTSSLFAWQSWIACGWFLGGIPEFFCEKLHSVTIAGPCRRLIFTINTVTSPRVAIGNVKLVLSAEMLADMAQMLAAASHTDASVLPSVPTPMVARANWTEVAHGGIC
jgi:hypothetical protein